MAEEPKIPIFSVLKNGAIHKNIILNNPRWLSAKTNGPDDSSSSSLLIGRHPDCHVQLDHPSISRFHLEIRADPASMKLSVTDLSSVHGTWVSGHRIEPKIPVELMEGDTIKLGASTRLYCLHWIPMSSAFDMDNPLPPVLEEHEPCAKEIPSLPLEAENWIPHNLVSELVVMEGENSTPQINLNDIEESLSHVFEENKMFIGEIPSLPLETENLSPQSLVLEPVVMEGENMTQEKNMIDMENQLLPVVEERDVCTEEIPYLPLETENSSLQNLVLELVVMESQVPEKKLNDMEHLLLFVRGENEACTEEIPSLLLETENPSIQCLFLEAVVVEGENMTPEKNSDVEIPSPPVLEVIEVCSEERTSLPLETENSSLQNLVSEPVATEGENMTPENNLNDMENPFPAFLQDNEACREESTTLPLETKNSGLQNLVLKVIEIYSEESTSLPLETEKLSLQNLVSEPTVMEGENITPENNLNDIENPFPASLQDNEACSKEIPSLPLEAENSSPQNLVSEMEAMEGENMTPVKNLDDMENPLPPFLQDNEACSEEILPLPLEAENLTPQNLVFEMVAMEGENMTLEKNLDDMEKASPILQESEVCTEEIPSLPLETENSSPQNSVSKMVAMEGENMTPEKNLDDMENLSPVLQESEVFTEEIPSLPLETENSSLHVLESVVMETQNMILEKNFNDNDVQIEARVDSGSSLLSRRSKSKSVCFLSVQTGRSKLKNDQEIGIGGEESFCRALFKDDEEEETYFSDKENMTHLSSKTQKENNVLTASASNKSTLTTKATSSLKHMINLQEDEFCSDKENTTPGVSRTGKSKKHFEEELEETYVSDKENMTPLGSKMQKLKRSNVMKEASNESTLSPKATSSLKHMKSLEEDQEDVFCSDKENMTPGVSRTGKSKKLSSISHSAKRTPFKCLQSNSPSRNSSPLGFSKERAPFQSLSEKSPLGKLKNEICSDNSQCMEQVIHKEEEKKVWNMVVDVDCLLNEESRKSLQLLEGLKGTHLIVPRIVIRELDCMKRRESYIFFRKETKAASAALQWIDECMLKCSWWIHVQSSSETLPVPQTPPATPKSLVDDQANQSGAATSPSYVSFSTCGSLMEILSPTAEDHIIDCALLFKNVKRDEQFIILSKSVTLEIKAMAEGLICESSKEFHASLVNPYSKRFLWSSSSPRGSTWSCLDEVASFEKYCKQFPAVGRLAKPAEDVKGLKLILLHNSSHYGNTNLFR